MEYTALGDSGLTVSRLGLGCLAFGSGMDWMLDRSDSDLAYLEEPYEPKTVIGHE